jgi:hypothetical protein
VESTAFYVKGEDLGLMKRGPGVPTAQQFLQIDPVTLLPIGQPVSPPGPVALPNVRSEGYVDQYVALRIFSNGTTAGNGVVVGIGPGPGGTGSGQGGMVGMSCWASALPYI